MVEIVEAVLPNEVDDYEEEFEKQYGIERLHPNDAIDSLLRVFGSDEMTPTSKPIIDEAQYQVLKERRMRVEYFMLKIISPKGVVGIVPANKRMKFIREGYSPYFEGESQRKPRRSRARPAQEPVATDSVVAYKCNDKYPGCIRFFDSLKGLQFHQRRDHEGALKKKDK